MLGVIFGVLSVILPRMGSVTLSVKKRDSFPCYLSVDIIFSYMNKIKETCETFWLIIFMIGVLVLLLSIILYSEVTFVVGGILLILSAVIKAISIL